MHIWPKPVGLADASDDGKNETWLERMQKQRTESFVKICRKNIPQ